MRLSLAPAQRKRTTKSQVESFCRLAAIPGGAIFAGLTREINHFHAASVITVDLVGIFVIKASGAESVLTSRRWIISSSIGGRIGTSPRTLWFDFRRKKERKKEKIPRRALYLHIVIAASIFSTRFTSLAQSPKVLNYNRKVDFPKLSAPARNEFNSKPFVLQTINIQNLAQNKPKDV